MKNAKRYLAVALSFALFLALPLAFTQEAAAASKTKVTQPSTIVTTENWDYGEGFSGSRTGVTTFAYDKKGLSTLRASQEDGKITEKSVSTYNKSGYETSYTEYNEKDEPKYQEVYTVKKGKVKAEAYYNIDGSKVDLESYAKIDYKNGKTSKVTIASADGKYLRVMEYKKGVLSKITVADSENKSQQVIIFDKYGNMTSETKVYENAGTRTTVYKNTYKNGKLVKTAWTRAWSDSKSVITGLTVYTYKKGKLVKTVAAETSSDIPNETRGETTVYAYTKGGLIKTRTIVESWTTATETKINRSEVTAYQYKNVAVDKKCVKAVKEFMADAYSYERFLPGGVNSSVYSVLYEG